MKRNETASNRRPNFFGSPSQVGKKKSFSGPPRRQAPGLDVINSPQYKKINIKKNIKIKNNEIDAIDNGGIG